MNNSFIAISTGNAPAGLVSISNTPFFPAINLADTQKTQRLDGTVSPERLRAAVIEAMASVNTELSVWADQHKSQGRATLAQVPADMIDGESVLLHRYRRAVSCWANANLVERYRSFDSTRDGHSEADKLEPTADDLRRDARWAISDMLHQSRTVIELI